MDQQNEIENTEISQDAFLIFFFDKDAKTCEGKE